MPEESRTHTRKQGRSNPHNAGFILQVTSGTPDDNFRFQLAQAFLIQGAGARKKSLFVTFGYGFPVPVS